MRLTVLECEVCGQKNRVDLEKPPENVVCGSCKEPMEDVIYDFLALGYDDSGEDDIVDADDDELEEDEEFEDDADETDYDANYD